MKRVLFGIRFSDCQLRPAAGARGRETGTLENVGTGGFDWSSSPYAAGDRNASFVGFTASYVQPFRTDNRSYALSVRCVQHLRRSCFFVRGGRDDPFSSADAALAARVLRGCRFVGKRVRLVGFVWPTRYFSLYLAWQTGKSTLL